MRVRTKAITEQTGVHGYNHNGGPFTSNPKTCTLFVEERTISDVSTPGWNALLRSGAIVNNPMSMTVSSTRADRSGHMIQTQIGNPSNMYETNGTGTLTSYLQQTYGGTSYGGTTDINVARWMELVKTECLSNIDPTPLSFAEDIGELRETLRFLKNPVRSLFNKAKRIKKLRTRYNKSRYRTKLQDREEIVKTVGSAVADAYLTERFAVGPILKTISNAMVAYETFFFQNKRKTARAFRNGITDKISGTMTYSAGIQIDYLHSLEESLDVHVGCIYEIVHPLEQWRYEAGLRYKDIPETLWNLVPTSFMVDRILNISNSIRAITNLADPNVKILSGWATTKRTQDTSVSAVAVRESGYDSFVTPDILTDHVFSMERELWHPTFADVLPSFELGNLVDDATKIADLLALSVKLLVD